MLQYMNMVSISRDEVYMRIVIMKDDICHLEGNRPITQDYFVGIFRTKKRPVMNLAIHERVVTVYYGL